MASSSLVRPPSWRHPSPFRRPIWANRLPVAERVIAVDPKALINDLLNAFAAVTDATGETISNALFFVGVEPNFAARWVQALAQNPDLAASIASAVITLELLDLVDIPSPLIDTIASLLPPQLGEPISQAYANLINFIDPGRLGGLLPDPVDGINAINAALLPPLVDNLTNGFLQAFDSVGVSIWGALIFVGQMPNTLLSVAQSAVTDPADIPGLASFLAYSLINPFSNPVLIDSIYSLAIEPLIDGTIGIAPPPIGGAGGLVATVKNSLDNALTAILDALPPPDFPTTPFVSPLIAPAQEVSSTEVVNPAANARVVNLQIADSQVVDSGVVEDSAEQDPDADANPASVQEDTPEADDPGTSTKKDPALDVTPVQLNVKKVNPLAGDLNDKQATTTTTGSSDQAATETPDVGKAAEAAPGDPDSAGAEDDNADADQGAE